MIIEAPTVSLLVLSWKLKDSDLRSRRGLEGLERLQDGVPTTLQAGAQAPCFLVQSSTACLPCCRFPARDYDVVANRWCFTYQTRASNARAVELMNCPCCLEWRRTYLAKSESVRTIKPFTS